MPRTKSTKSQNVTEQVTEQVTENSVETQNVVEDVVKPEPQTIVPVGIRRVYDKYDYEEVEAGILKKFNINQKKFIVYENGNQIEELYENDEKIKLYLDRNKQQLQEWIDNLKVEVTDPNLLLLFNVGQQNRNYITYDAYFSQNGLAPKPCVYKTWLSYFTSQNPSLTEEEIAIQVNGNLKYSFSIVQN